MPLARIVSSTPDQVATLSEYLRSRGYDVEVVARPSSQDATADLQLDVEGCSSDQAMARAKEAVDAAAHHARQPIAYDITGRPVAFADEELPPPRPGSALAGVWNGLRSAGREIIEDLSLVAGRMGEWLAEGRETIHRRRERAQESRRLARERAQESRRQAEEENTREREARMLAQQVERARRQEEEAAQARDQAATQALRMEEKRRRELADRERRLLEQYRHEARRDVVQERFTEEQAEAQQRVAAAETTLAVRDVSRPPRRLSQRDGDWKKAAAASIALALLVTLGYAAYQNRQPAAPLTNRDLVQSRSVSQKVPFGAATAPPPASAPKASHVAGQASPNPNLPQHDAPVAQAPSPASAENAAAKPHPRTTPLRHRSGSDDGVIAEDQVIVYHNGKSRARTASTTSGPKRISDLDQ